MVCKYLYIHRTGEKCFLFTNSEYKSGMRIDSKTMSNEISDLVHSCNFLRDQINEAFKRLYNFCVSKTYITELTISFTFDYTPIRHILYEPFSYFKMLNLDPSHREFINIKYHCDNLGVQPRDIFPIFTDDDYKHFKNGKYPISNDLSPDDLEHNNISLMLCMANVVLPSFLVMINQLLYDEQHRILEINIKANEVYFNTFEKNVKKMKMISASKKVLKKQQEEGDSIEEASDADYKKHLIKLQKELTI